MYIRTTKSRNSTCFQIGYKHQGRFVLVKHIGCASSPIPIEALKIKAKEDLAKEALRYQLSFPLLLSEKEPLAKLTNWHITGFHDCFGKVYDTIGFPENILRDLVIARITYPRSKLATIKYLNNSLGINLSVDKVYRFLDRLDKDELTTIAFKFVSQRSGSISLVFYDVTTLYFETDQEDEFRRKGYSKDHRNDVPQILIGLFVDNYGYPFDFDFFDGKTFEGHTFQIAIKRLIDKYRFTTLTVVADAGMLSEANLAFLASLKLNYIVGARLKNLGNALKQQIFTFDFTQNRICQLPINEINQNLIVDFSRDRNKRDKLNREKLIKKLELKIESKQKLIYKNKYLRLKGKKQASSINWDKIKEDERYDGLKGYLTNITEGGVLSPNEIITEYHNLWKIEKAFRMSKGDLKERPIYHRNSKRIQAHLTICFCSLLVMKETERILAGINISLAKAIEILGGVGRGQVTIGKTKLQVGGETSQEAGLILKTILGH